MRTDIRLAVRSLVKRPVFSLVAIVSIALGVGFNAAIFSAVNALLIRPVSGLVEPERVVDLGRMSRGSGHDTFTYPDFVDIRDASTTLEEVAAVRLEAASWATDDGGVRIEAAGVTPGYFPAMGATAARGRVFGAEHEGPASPADAVVSHDFWRHGLGGDPDVVGRVLRINRNPFTVIGVAPEGFRGHVGMLETEIWLPLAPGLMAGSDFLSSTFDDRRSSWILVVGRLAPGASVRAADAEVKTIMAQLAEAYPESNEHRSARVVALGAVPGAGRSMVSGFLGLLMGLVGMIMLITAANVAGMLLARAAAREKEIAIRLAIGAGRSRLLRQLVAESVVLFTAGGVIGMVLAVWATSFLSSLRMPGPETIVLDLSADGTVALFALGLALLTGLVFGLVPALQATRPDLVPALKDERRTGKAGGRSRRAFAAGQIGLSLVLLVAAGLFLRSLQRAGTVDPGFDPEGVSVVSFHLGLDGYDEARGLVFHDALLDRLRAMPGVAAAALTMDLPLDLSSNGSGAYPEGRDAPDGRGIGTEFNMATTGYFETLRIPVLRGRVFTPADGPESEPVVLVNRALAEEVWPGEDPVGKGLRVFGRADIVRTVVGVTADVKNQTLGETVGPMTYLPFAQAYRPQAYAIVRGTGITAAALRREILAVDPALALGPVQSLKAVTDIGILPQRIAAALATALGALALFLSALGIYGVIAFSVAQRRREMGIRLAVGATTAAVAGLVVRTGLRLALPGLLLGALAAFGLSRLLTSLLFGLSPFDPVTFGAVVTVLVGVVIAASWVPARRAARTDPMEALRAE